MISTARNIRVQIWSDVICPWCWIGLTLFEQALAAFEHRDRVEVVHRSFRLMRGVAPGSERELTAARMGLAPDAVPGVLRQIEDMAASLGLSYRLDDILSGDTLDAHRLVKLAAAHGLGHVMLVRLYRACLSEEISVFEPVCLVALAEEVGLEPAETRALLGSGHFRNEVEQDYQQLQRLEGAGVPFFMVGSRYRISGAQPIEVFTHALTRTWTEAAAPPALPGDGTACTPLARVIH